MFFRQHFRLPLIPNDLNKEMLRNLNLSLILHMSSINRNMLPEHVTNTKNMFLFIRVFKSFVFCHQNKESGRFGIFCAHLVVHDKTLPVVCWSQRNFWMWNKINDCKWTERESRHHCLTPLCMTVTLQLQGSFLLEGVTDGLCVSKKD